MRWTLIGIAWLGACGGAPAPDLASSEGVASSEGAAPSPAPAAAPAPEPPSSPAAMVDLAAAREALRGAWVVRTEVDQAWFVDGERVTVVDVRGERALTMGIEAPCLLSVKDEAAGVTTYTVFAVDGDQRYIGLGSAAVPVEGGAVACTGGKVVLARPDGCTAWRQRFGRWEETALSSCAFSEASVEVDGTTMERRGGVWVNAQMSGNLAVAHPDLASARAAIGG